MNENSITISAPTTPENANVSVFFCSVVILDIRNIKKKKLKLDYAEIYLVVLIHFLRCMP